MMTNEEKYKTVEARREAFKKYCKDHVSCKSCGFSNSEGLMECSFQWLAANAEPSIADIVAAMRSKTEVMKNSWYTLEGWRKLCDALDAAAKRAYERIDGAMRNGGMSHADVCDCERMREVLDETIGGYHG